MSTTAIPKPSSVKGMGGRRKPWEKRTQEIHKECSVLNKNSRGGSQIPSGEMQGKSFPAGSAYNSLRTDSSVT